MTRTAWALVRFLDLAPLYARIKSVAGRGGAGAPRRCLTPLTWRNSAGNRRRKIELPLKRARLRSSHMIRPQAGTAAAARPDRRSTLMHVLAAAVLLSMATHADAYVIKTWAANGVYDATELECRLAPPPPLPEGCFGIPFTAQLEYIDARPGQDDQIGIGQVGLLRFIDRSQSLSFEYTPTGALPPLLRPADLLAVLVQEQGDAIVFSASVRRAGSPATLWTFETNGAFHMDNGHGEGGVGSAGAVQWQLLRSTDVPEPGSLVLVGLALASIGIQRRAWAANRGW